MAAVHSLDSAYGTVKFITAPFANALNYVLSTRGQKVEPGLSSNPQPGHRPRPGRRVPAPAGGGPHRPAPARTHSRDQVSISAAPILYGTAETRAFYGTAHEPLPVLKLRIASFGGDSERQNFTNLYCDKISNSHGAYKYADEVASGRADVKIWPTEVQSCGKRYQWAQSVDGY
ncbi:hypothetical protein EVAR_103533_1 [Eumeta japonica]|uniref:Uncharacterized protein n=1 Tax=Eumeta variegata TaxID=151549 RepID=A0A4C1YXH6_EUMVA|nr:hypothetical protein EVAR_103533_1 [Eumeta japonica]